MTDGIEYIITVGLNLNNWFLELEIRGILFFCRIKDKELYAMKKKKEKKKTRRKEKTNHSNLNSDRIVPPSQTQDKKWPFLHIF